MLPGVLDKAAGVFLNSWALGLNGAQNLSGLLPSQDACFHFSSIFGGSLIEWMSV